MITRSGDVVWITRVPREVALSRSRRSTAALLARTLALAGLGGGIGLTALTMLPPPGPAQAAVGVVASAAVKDAARLPVWNGPLPARTVKAAALGAAPAWGLFDTRPLAPDAAHFAERAPTATAGFVPQAVETDWREQEFAEVTAVDGRTLGTRDGPIRLAGLALPEPDRMCRTLDGRTEPCVARAATQLDLMTRWRKVTCRYRREPAGDTAGTCRIGANDLAERLLRTGYVHRDAAPAEPSRTASAPATAG